MKTDEPFESDEAAERALDGLLNRARFAEPSVESQLRLRDRWIQITRARRRRHAVQVAIAAAIVLVAAGVVVMKSIPPPGGAAMPSGPKYLSLVPDAPSIAPGQSRPANNWERLVVRSGAQHQPPRATEIATETAPPDVDVSLILRQVADPALRKVALQSLRDLPEPPVEKLVAELRSPLMQRRFDAARALGALGGPEVIQALQQLLAHEESRREALAALMCSDDPSARALLQSARRSRSIDAQCIAIQSQINPGM